MKKETLEAILSKESQYSLSSTVSAFIGFEVDMKVVTQTNRKGDIQVYIDSDPISMRTFGMMKFLFKTFRLGSFGSIYMGEEGKPWFSLHCSYEHQNGGSNGHEFGIDNQRINLTFDEKSKNWFVGVN